MRLWPRRRARTPVALPRVELAPIVVQVAHEVRHVYEPKPRPDSVRFQLWSAETGQMFQILWHNVAIEEEFPLPDHLAKGLRLRAVPEFRRY